MGHVYVLVQFMLALVRRPRRPARARRRSTCGRSCSPPRWPLDAQANEYLFLVIASPAGAYFSGGVKPVSVWLSEEYVRAAPAAPARPDEAMVLYSFGYVCTGSVRVLLTFTCIYHGWTWNAKGEMAICRGPTASATSSTPRAK